MNKEIPVRARPANVIGLALVTMLAFVVAPVCAPLCAARTCSSGTSQGKCHDMASMGADGGEKFVVAGKACRTSDFSAVLARANEQSFLSQEVRRHIAPPFAGASPEHNLGSFDESPGRWGLHRGPLESADSRVLTTILRI